MKSKIMAGVLMFIIISVLLTGCGGKQKEIPYPDGYYVPKPEETETAGKSDKSQKNASETAKETTRETIQARAGGETENKKISFYLDTSGSMQRSPEVVKIHAAATKCAAGYEERHFYSVDSKNLIETTEQLALSGQYGRGAPIDLIRDGTLPCDPEGVNVLTTDLQTGTSCSEIGKWLVNTGATGYSFYVFTMQYNGSLQFKIYTSSSVLETVSVKDCSFAQKEFLMIVFGKNSLVEDYDQFFQYKLGTEVPYDTCHVSLHAEEKQDSNFLQLTSSKCFKNDIANVTYDNTNYVFGMSTRDYIERRVLFRRSYVRPEGVPRRLQDEKKKEIVSFCNQIKNSEEKEEWKKNLTLQLHYPDLLKLSQEWREGRLQIMVKNSVNNYISEMQLAAEECEVFQKAVYSWIEEFAQENLITEKMREMREDREGKELQLKDEFNRASIFSDLRTCFSQIKEKTRFQVPAVIQAQEVEQIAMINSEIGRDWQTKGYDITEVRDEQIAVMNNLYPYEIVYMKFGKYIDLTNGEQTEQQLRMVFR